MRKIHSGTRMLVMVIVYSLLCILGVVAFAFVLWALR